MQRFISRNIRKAFFWDNIRNFLILELKSSISWNIRNFFRGVFFLFFFELGLKNVPGSSIIYYWLWESGIYFRRYRKSNITEVTQAILQNFSGSSKSFGYRLMHQKLCVDGFIDNRETVRILLKVLDADGAELRSPHRLARRVYFSVGPNYLWHMDRYDQIKPYGFEIHDAIDGFSRKILWLRVSSSNNNPKVIASSYMDCIS